MRNIEPLKSKMARRAQEQYDLWQQDEEGNDIELGTGGICQEIAREICNVLRENGFEAWEQCATTEQHVYCLTICSEGIIEVDIPYSIYERGYAYTWKKIPNIVFSENDVYTEIINKNIDSLNLYLNDDEYTSVLRP